MKTTRPTRAVWAISIAGPSPTWGPPPSVSPLLLWLVGEFLLLCLAAAHFCSLNGTAGEKGSVA